VRPDRLLWQAVERSSAAGPARRHLRWRRVLPVRLL